jgi:hypothetical protein
MRMLYKSLLRNTMRLPRQAPVPARTPAESMAERRARFDSNELVGAQQVVRLFPAVNRPRGAEVAVRPS